MCGIAVLIDYSRSQCHDLPVDRAVEAAGTSDDAHSQLDEGEGPTSSRLAQIAADASHKLRERGPDAFNTITIDNVTFLSSVLGLRGQLTPQPLVSAAGNVLCFNGEIFDGLEVS